MEKIIILGCGYIGTNVANFFASKENNNKIYMLGIENYYTKYLNKRIEFIPMKTEEITNENIDIFENSIVIDATGSTNATSSFEVTGIACLENCISKVKLINILYELKVNKYIFLSSGGTVYRDSRKRHKENEASNPLNVYALEKVIIEKFIQINSIENPDFNYLILRLANPYGGIVSPDKKQGIIDVTINKLLKGETINFYGDINNVRDYIYIDDLSKVIYEFAFLQTTNDIYNVGTGKGYTIKEVLEKIEKIYQTKINVENNSVKTINIRSNILDIDKMKQTLKFQPITGLEEGIKKIKIQRVWRE